MKQEYTNAIAWAGIILTASTMGYASDMTKIAHKVLFDGYRLAPYMAGRFNSEAIRLHNIIATDKRTYEANRIAENILIHAGY